MFKGLTGAAGLGVLLASQLALAADHLDGPAAKADHAADITDIYAWMSADAKTMYLVMNVFPMASTTSKFSNAVQYVFHTNSKNSFTDTALASSQVNIICTFDANQKVSCWAGGEYVNGDASSTAGISSGSGKLKVFAGLRDDPFFFNLDGFNKVADTVKSAKGTLTFDAAGCPLLDPATANSLVNQLKQSPTGGPAQDFFARLNVLSIVLAVDKTVITKGGPIVSFWGSTNRAQ
jgi:hypothetical protein